MMMCVIVFTDQLNFFSRGIVSSISEKLVKQKFANSIAIELSNGFTVTNTNGSDDRLVQKNFIQLIKKCPNTIVLGSSRVRLISGNILKDSSIINSGVSSASLEDIVALYYLYEKRDCDIKEVIIGIDPWILNDENDLNSWRTLENEYYMMANMLFNNNTPQYPYFKPTPLRNLKALFSYKYFTSSLQYLRKNIAMDYKIANKRENLGTTISPDGSLTYSAKTRNLTQQLVDLKAKGIIENDEGKSLSNYTALSNRYSLIFTKFINHLQKKNIKIIFYFPPFHPTVFHTLKTTNKYKISLEAEAYFKEFALKNKIKIIGSYNPEDNNLTSHDFVDGVHIRENGIKQIFNQYNLR
jgi:hypothetical protein